ncbi:MAG TPA: hypothetical protein PLR78_17790 [Polaromonas sp.]|jgi:hypothetical protein|uniref:hypothetical protein n=1 Tax=Polaromonas sp. TaxID=1869339 RepID=UPI002C10190A|nr:hypothetical protein [Polaromonas sp.]HQS33630.1 hypothetical protein [Polaromonas sp.]
MEKFDEHQTLRLLWPVFPARPTRQKPHLLFSTGLSERTTQAVATNQNEDGPDYRDNKSRIQRDWLDRNPNYWREYRKKEVNKPQPSFSESPVVDRPMSGLYHIRFVPNTDLAKSDAWIAEITPACMSCPCKVNACKDST